MVPNLKGRKPKQRKKQSHAITNAHQAIPPLQLHHILEALNNVIDQNNRSFQEICKFKWLINAEHDEPPVFAAPLEGQNNLDSNVLLVII